MPPDPINSIRKIIHIDMDAFFASVEQRDHPELQGKPIAVGGNRQRGVVAAASYEARKFGVHSAMPGRLAQRRCPQLIFITPRFEIYRKVSEEIMQIFRQYTPLVEPLSLDEAYLDVSTQLPSFQSTISVAEEIRNRIFEKTRLTASAGVSTNKFLSKLASDMKKPNGLTVITNDEAKAILEKLPIEKFHGIGKATAKKMHNLKIFTGSDLKQWKREALCQQFGKIGSYFFDIVRGHDHRKVLPNRERKSIGAERTFSKDLTEFSQILENLRDLCTLVSHRLDEKNKRGRTLTLKIRYPNFKTHTHSKTFEKYFSKKEEIFNLSKKLFLEIKINKIALRLLGITVSQFKPENREQNSSQLSLDFVETKT